MHSSPHKAESISPLDGIDNLTFHAKIMKTRHRSNIAFAGLTKRTLFGLPIAALLIAHTMRMEASTILPGLDLLQTPTQPATIPGLGDVTEHGIPIGPGNTDTIIQRFNGLADGQSGVIIAQIVGLSVGGTILDGPFVGDNFQVALDPSHPSLGQLNVQNPSGGTGGTFSSFFDVFTDITISQGSSTVAVVPHEDLITSVGNTPWATTPTPGYPNDPNHPSGGFYITSAGVQHTGPHPNVIPATTPDQSATFTLLCFGLAGLFGYSRFQRKLA
jgi:hypothetical protein